MLSSMFRTTDVVPLSAFLRLMLVSRYRVLNVSRSAGLRLSFGFLSSSSASFLTSSQ